MRLGHVIGILAALILFHRALGLTCAISQPALFREAGEEWGLTRPVIYGHEGEQNTLLELTGPGVAVVDYDNDGRPDLFFVNGSRLEGFGADSPAVSMLYRNLGDRFEDVTERSGVGRSGWGQGVCIGDYDNDTWTDLYVTYYGHNVLYRNRGDGTFEERGRQAGVEGERPQWGAGCTFVDYNRDGNLDLFAANYVGYKEVATLEAEAKCKWKGMPIPCGPLGLSRVSNLLYRNNGNGTFTDVSKVSGITDAEGYYSFQPITADFDSDGWPDIYVSCDSKPNILYRNNRNGTFTDVGLVSGSALNGDGTAQAGMGVAAGDFDGDGRPDIVVTNFSEDTPTLYKNLGEWRFSDNTFAARLGLYRRYLGWGVLFPDWDNDGWEDLFIVNGHVYREVDKYGLGSYRQSKQLYRNQQDGTFEDMSAGGGPAILRKTAARGAASEDFNGDGKLDLVVTNLNELPSLLINQNQSGNWITIQLIGDRSNRSAIGTRVIVEAAGHKQCREVRSASSYYSSSGLRLHFGLGKTQRIDSLQAFWPSGEVSRFADLGANRMVVIREKGGVQR